MTQGCPKADTAPSVATPRPRILVVEDDWLIAEHLRYTLEDGGFEVLGPVGTIPEALDQLSVSPTPDAAVLDVNLLGRPAYAVADALGERGIGYVLASGYDSAALPERYRNAPLCPKPVDPAYCAGVRETGTEIEQRTPSGVRA